MKKIIERLIKQHGRDKYTIVISNVLRNGLEQICLEYDKSKAGEGLELIIYKELMRSKRGKEFLQEYISEFKDL